MLEAVSRSPTELQAVLDTIADSAARLCGTERALIGLVHRDAFRAVGGVGVDGQPFTLADPGPEFPLARNETAGARAIVDRTCSA